MRSPFLVSTVSWSRQSLCGLLTPVLRAVRDAPIEGGGRPLGIHGLRPAPPVAVCPPDAARAGWLCCGRRAPLRARCVRTVLMSLIVGLDDCSSESDVIVAPSALDFVSQDDMLAMQLGRLVQKYAAVSVFNWVRACARPVGGWLLLLANFSSQKYPV